MWLHAAANACRVPAESGEKVVHPKGSDTCHERMLMMPKSRCKAWRTGLVYLTAWYGPAALCATVVPRCLPYTLAVLGGWMFDAIARCSASSDPLKMHGVFLLAGALLSTVFPLGTAAFEWGMDRKLGYKANLRAALIIVLVLLSLLWHGSMVVQLRPA